MRARVKEVAFAQGRRIIAISDIHGSLDLFQRLLAKVDYTADDILVLVGDLIEKGTANLATLRFIIQLSQKNEVHVLSGNCDTLWEDIKADLDDENLLRYMLVRQKSILNEMCQELSLAVNEQTDMRYIKRQIRQNYSRELNWLERLPHIIASENFVFAHAGIKPGSLWEQDAGYVMKNDAFLRQGFIFPYYVVVGHWPTANYGKTSPCCNPIICKERKIICLDGGNTVRREGQLNALIINDLKNITFTAVDNLKKEEIIADQEANISSINIPWSDNRVQVLKPGEEFTRCRHLSSGHELWIQSNRIFETSEGMRCYDCTDLLLPLSKGNQVSIVERTSRYTLAKKDGLIGWVANDKLQSWQDRSGDQQNRLMSS